MLYASSFYKPVNRVMKFLPCISCFFIVVAFAANDNLPSTPGANTLSHASAHIPAQCYTNPLATDGSVSNPCYACHSESQRPNKLNDYDVQLEYSFPESAMENPWVNMFRDNSSAIATISDESIMAYVQQSNYFTTDGKITLVERLKENIETYDVNGNGLWDGYLPDSYFNFDNAGYDRAPDGRYTGWRSYAYYPLPGSFMPTNGATDDVSIRLAEEFRNNENGQFDLKVYNINLAIVEAMIREADVTIEAVDENSLGIDLDKNGELSLATKIKYDWAPLDKRYMTYVGQAKQLLEQGQVHIAAKLFPEGTEFLHSVRYLNVNSLNRVSMAPRMKELRYAKKRSWLSYYDLEVIVANEIKERHDFPDRTKQIRGSLEEGVEIPQGWVYQGFIEDKIGELRPQSYEEQATCTGCHSGMGILTDSTISFFRKLPQDSFQQGWYHWSQHGFEGTPEPKRQSDGEYEYSYYLKNNPTGDEFRSNLETKDRFFDTDGKPKEAEFEGLHQDISLLMLPSAERARALNKAYKLIVEEQSYIKGRVPILGALDEVLFKQIKDDQLTGIQQTLSAF
jgi:hypothetical protein